MGPVRAVAAGFVGKAKRSAGNRRLVAPAVELYANGNGSESGQGRGCDCDWDDYGSCDSSDCGQRAVEVADVHKHGCSPGHLEIVAISIRIGKYPSKGADRGIGKGAGGLWWQGRVSSSTWSTIFRFTSPSATRKLAHWLDDWTNRSSLPHANAQATTHNIRSQPTRERWLSSTKGRPQHARRIPAGSGGLGRMMVRVFVYPRGETEPHRGGLRM